MYSVFFEGRGLLIEMCGFLNVFLPWELFLFFEQLHVQVFLWNVSYIGCFYLDPFGGCQISATQGLLLVFWWLVSGTKFHTRKWRYKA